MVVGVGGRQFRDPWWKRVKQEKGWWWIWWIRASVMKFPTLNGKDGSLIEGQATKEG